MALMSRAKVMATLATMSVCAVVIGIGFYTNREDTNTGMRAIYKKERNQ